MNEHNETSESVRTWQKWHAHTTTRDEVTSYDQLVRRIRIENEIVYALLTALHDEEEALDRYAEEHEHDDNMNHASE